MTGNDESTPPWGDTLRGLARRVLGPVADAVHFAPLDFPPLDSAPLDPAPAAGHNNAGRHYEYEARGGDVTVAATDGVSAAVGLHHYLRERCGHSVGWDTPLPLPVRSLPDSPPSRGDARVRHGYYLNFCTFSYTMPYWDWADWEREIDWMALHGITMPLALTGHESVLHTAYTRLGMDDESIRGFLGGPGYLPFQFMGCLDTFAGPLPPSWLDSHRELGARILERERAFGMTPVLPAFTGHVPPQLAPQGSSRIWQGFETRVLDPSDSRYQQICTEIARAQLELFGSDHLYAADPFIEMIPVDADPAFPGAVARATLAGLRAADPEAVWVMQAWPFSYQRHFWTDERIRAFLDAIPHERMLIADLWAEYDPQWRRLEQFSGKPWLWCALLNFGGRTDPVADLPNVPQSIDAALEAPNPPSGIGLSMEATRNNPAFFELVADQIWNRVTDIGTWMDTFVDQRYSTRRDDDATTLRAAWRGLLDSIYAASGVRIFPAQFSGVVTAKPSYARIPDGLDQLRADIAGALWYSPGTLVTAWEQMIDVAERDRALAAGPLGHDLIEVGIAYLARLADRFFLDVVEQSVRLGTRSDEHVARFMRLFDDLDRLLATRDEFTYQHWEAKALSWASEPGDRDVLADNARRIITVWGTTTSPLLDDYSGRFWSGLVGGYYRDRWQLWAHGLDRALASDELGHDHDSSEHDLNRRLQERAEAFLRDGPHPPPEDLGDVATESRRVYTTYASHAGSLSRTPDHN
ncbi:alpha-N-acetylglucosaminidase [Actinobacteria bacterium YIM 96077]|uniref:Alpha-N-acetylglucosaminidase n=1 Tax=Phytoactinopolyspora halophila TaxID=1981511 RepID=A0A329QN06_9ACTN|nr:alpha-N-acetylglucosaminidase [Phytoactinopolyspora halophila]AYY12345.1 alpha-N-acetylglucosaminidase [Actinobacteria bacterium YIM 96077]RAW13737.1 alpha-N-acetylglucosaminidase [Phytoactinopolyspora halophila]